MEDNHASGNVGIFHDNEIMQKSYIYKNCLPDNCDNFDDLFCIYRICSSISNNETLLQIERLLGLQGYINNHLHTPPKYEAEDLCNNQENEKYWSSIPLQFINTTPNFKLSKNDTRIQLKDLTSGEIIKEENFCVYDAGGKETGVSACM